MAEIQLRPTFDAGIERILTHSDSRNVALPDAGNIASRTGRVEQELENVLFPPSLEQTLADSFRPEIRSLDLLTPVGYEAALSECIEFVEGCVKSDQSEDSLKPLQDLLGEEQELRLLLRTYRHLLHQA